MRRVALFSSPLVFSALMLSGCSGFGVFLDDTHSATAHMNRPIGNSENIRRVEGQPVATQPLTTEPGNVWPGPVPPEPTLEDLQNMPPGPPPSMTGITPPSISNVPTLVIPAIPHHIQPRPGLDGGVLNGPIGGYAPSPYAPGPYAPGPYAPGPYAPGPYAPPAATGPGQSPQGTITPTRRGAVVNTRNPSGIGQANVPGNATGAGITVPNGDGTSTVILPDGTIKTVPTPK